MILYEYKNLEPQATFRMGLPDAAVCFDSRSNSIYPSSGENPRLSYWKNPPSPPTLLFDPKILNLDSSSQWTLFHSSIVQCLWALANWRLLTLFCFLNSAFLTVILPYRSASQNILLIVDVDTLFRDIGSVVQWFFEQSAFCHLNLGLLWNFLLLLFSFMVYQLYFSSCFVPFLEVSQ